MKLSFSQKKQYKSNDDFYTHIVLNSLKYYNLHIISIFELTFTLINPTNYHFIIHKVF